MKTFQLTKLAACVALGIGLAACGGGGGKSSGSTGGTAAADAKVLDPAQAMISGVVTNLGTGLSVVDANSPLKVGAFVKCLDPAVNQLVDGPDGLLTELLKTVKTGVTGGANAGSASLDPMQVQNGVVALAGSLQSLTTTVPQALLTLAGQGTCSGGSGPGGSNPLSALTSLAGQSNTPLQPIIDALVAAGVPANGGGAGPTGTALDVILGPLSELAGGSQAPSSLAGLTQVVDQLGSGLEVLSTALGQSFSGQTQAVPVISGVVDLLVDTVTDVGTTLTSLGNSGTTNAQLLGILNTLVSTLSTQLGTLPGSSTLVLPNENDIMLTRIGLAAVTAPLTDLLSTLAGSGNTLQTGQVATLGSLLNSLLATVASSAPAGTTPSATTTNSLNGIPVIGGILGGLLGLSG